MKLNCRTAVLVGVTIVVGLATGLSWSAPPDLSTPKSTALAFSKAMEAGNAEVAKAATLADADNQELVGTMAAMVDSVNKLGEAAKAKFGDEGSQQITEKMKGMDMSKQLEAAEVKEDGDTATVANSQSPSHPYKLKKVGGEWKFDMVGTVGTTAGPNITQQIPVMKAVGTAMGDLATEINEGKYKTVEEVQSAKATKIFGAMAAMKRSTSAPATQPAK